MIELVLKIFNSLILKCVILFKFLIGLTLLLLFLFFTRKLLFQFFKFRIVIVDMHCTNLLKSLILSGKRLNSPLVFPLFRVRLLLILGDLSLHLLNDLLVHSFGCLFLRSILGLLAGFLELTLRL